MKVMFKKFFMKIKETFNNNNLKKAKSTVTFVVISLATGFFAFKYVKTFKLLNKYKALLKDTQMAFTAVNAQCTQLTLDNTVLSEMLGMVLGVSGNIYT